MTDQLTQDLGRDLVEGEAATIIRRAVAKMRLPQQADREEAEQELRLQLLRRIEKYEPDRGSWPAFAQTVVQRLATNLRGAANAKRRRLVAGSTCDGYSLVDHAVTNANAESTAQSDRRLDIELLLRQVPDLVAVFEKLSGETVTGTARQLKIPRRTLRGRLKRALTTAVSLGLYEYVDGRRHPSERRR